MHDRATMILNTMLLFVVLFYVYPVEVGAKRRRLEHAHA